MSPVKSDAQRRFMYATEEGKTDAPEAVGEEFIEASHGLSGLPARKHPVKGMRPVKSTQRSVQPMPKGK